MDKPKELRRQRLAGLAGYFGSDWYKNLSEANAMTNPFEGFWMKPARTCDREKQRPAVRWEADPGHSGSAGVSMNGLVY